MTACAGKPGTQDSLAPDEQAHRTADTDSDGAARSQVSEMRRSRILEAMVEVVGERGFADASVGLVVSRARVSRRTFNEYFANREACFLAVLDVGLEHVTDLISEAFEREQTWQDAVRTALATLLVFFDSEPLLARVWLVESLAAGEWAHQHRSRNIATLRELVLSYWPVLASRKTPPLAADSVLASILGIVHTHLVTAKPRPLIELLAPLMGAVCGPYLSPRAISDEITRAEELVQRIQSGESEYTRLVRRNTPDPARTPALPAILRNPNARRARECLQFLLERPGSSNRQIATAIGIAHQSQISKLLTRLLTNELVAKQSHGAGRPNAWQLTPLGEKASHTLTGT